MYGLVPFKVLFKFNQGKLSESFQIMVYTIGRRIVGNVGNIIVIIKVIFGKRHLWVFKLLDTLAFVH